MVANPVADFEKPGLNLGEFIQELDGLEDRAGPEALDEVSLSARLRYLRRIDYKPAPLKAVAAEIEAFQPRPDPQRYFAP